jgi:hypothetical protein
MAEEGERDECLLDLAIFVRGIQEDHSARFHAAYGDRCRQFNALLARVHALGVAEDLVEVSCPKIESPWPGAAEPLIRAKIREIQYAAERLYGRAQAAWQSASAPEPEGGVQALALERLERLCNRFHAVVRQLRSRHEGRPTLDVSDEYDVQDLLHALLVEHFDDVRPEEYTPSYAGSSSRTDFLLRAEEIVIEAKKTRKGLAAKEVGNQLIVDIARYKAHPACKALVCFVYDPEGRISNPRGIEADLESAGDDQMRVRVFIRPTD